MEPVLHNATSVRLKPKYEETIAYLSSLLLPNNQSIERMSYPRPKNHFLEQRDMTDY